MLPQGRRHLQLGTMTISRSDLLPRFYHGAGEKRAVVFRDCPSGVADADGKGTVKRHHHPPFKKRTLS